MEEFVDPRTFLKCSKSDFIFSCVNELKSVLIEADWSISLISDVRSGKSIVKPRAKGSTAHIYDVFDRNDSERHYIMKFIFNPMRGQESIDKEVCLQNQAYRLGMAPKIIDAWMCGENLNNGIIIMEIFKGITLFDFLEYLTQNKNKDVTLKLTMQLYRVMFKIFIKAYELNEAGIFHHDLNLGNILIKIENDEATDVQFIDFGLADTRETIFSKVLSLDEFDSVAKMADAVTNVFKEMNVDRILPLQLLMDYLKSPQAKESVKKNKYFLPVLRKVIQTFYNEFILPRLKDMNQPTWSENGFKKYVDQLSSFMTTDINYLIDDENYDIDADEIVSQILNI